MLLDLYKTNNNVINADINAALNIQMSRGLISPRRIYVYL